MAGATAQLAVLHLHVPARKVAQAEQVWRLLRESFADEDTHLRLRRNGIRCGIGNVRDWPAIRAALEGIEGLEAFRTQPVRVPAGFPVALELDSAPRTQTLFYVDAAGILHGDTWVESRNVLRVTYGADNRSAARLRIQVVPEVHQDLEGWRWVRTESGLWQVPNQARQAFDAAGFTASLGRDEFLLVAPDPAAGSFLLVGSAFLTMERERGRYNSYVFLRPEVSDVGEREP